MLDRYPPIEPPAFASGGVCYKDSPTLFNFFFNIFYNFKIQSVANPVLCIDTLGADKEEAVGLYPCKGDLKNPGYRQHYTLRNHRDIYIEDSAGECLDFNHGKVLLYPCKFNQDNQYFRYDLNTKQIYCGRKRDNNCIEMDPKMKNVFVAKCYESKNTQKWNWGSVNETMLRNWADYGKPILDKLERKDFNLS